MVRIPLAALLPLLAAFVAGPLRYYSHWPFALCVALALPAVAAAAMALRRAPGVRADASVGVLFAAAALLFAALMVRWLYNPALDGLAASDSGAAMAALHARAGVRFAGHQPDVAHGQVALYALIAAARWLGILPFASLRFTFYLVVCVLAVAMAGAAAIAAAALPSRRAIALFAAVYAPLAIVALRWNLVPLLHAYQAAGEFPQLLSFVPIVVVWLLFAVVEAPYARALIGLGGLALVRFTYAINVGDLALALAMLGFADAVAASAAERRRLLAICAGWLVVGVVALRQLFAARALMRPAPAIEQLWMQLVLLMAALALVAIPELAMRAGITVPPSLRRLVALARNLALVSWLVTYSYVTAHLFEPKTVPLGLLYNSYLLVPLVIVVVALLPSVALLVSALVERATHDVPLLSVAAPVALAFAALATWSLTAACPAVLGELRERAFGRPPFQHIKPLDDRDADRFIAAVMRARHEPFGGFFATGTTVSFLDAAWDAPPSLPSWLSTSPPPPGRCYFWSPADADATPLGAELRAHEQPLCRQYHPRWAPATTTEICAVCL